MIKKVETSLTRLMAKESITEGMPSVIDKGGRWK
jgi:hypothetical protein